MRPDASVGLPVQRVSPAPPKECSVHRTRCNAVTYEEVLSAELLITLF
jgi:hypothetical protein